MPKIVMRANKSGSTEYQPTTLFFFFCEVRQTKNDSETPKLWAPGHRPASSYDSYATVPIVCTAILAI